MQDNLTKKKVICSVVSLSFFCPSLICFNLKPYFLPRYKRSIQNKVFLSSAKQQGMTKGLSLFL